MWVRIRRRKLKTLRNDISLPSGVSKQDIPKSSLMTMRGAKINQRHTLNFELIESIFDKEKRAPRQRAKYLGTISEDDLKIDFKREHFWQRIDSKLKRLKLDSASCEKIREKINDYVPYSG